MATRSSRNFRFPMPPPHYAEIALRGMSTMVPALQAYAGKPPRPYVDGGYYVRTRENRPLIGPTADRGRLCFLRLFGLRRDGVLRRRRSDRAPHHRRDAARLCAGVPAVALSRPEYMQLCSISGATAGSYELDPSRPSGHDIATPRDAGHGQVHQARRRRNAAEDDQCRYRHDHPEAIPEDHQAHRAWQGPVLREALQGRRQREPGFRAQQAGLSQRQDFRGGRQFRLRLIAASTRRGRCSTSASAA